MYLNSRISHFISTLSMSSLDSSSSSEINEEKQLVGGVMVENILSVGTKDKFSLSTEYNVHHHDIEHRSYSPSCKY